MPVFADKTKKIFKKVFDREEGRRQRRGQKYMQILEGNKVKRNRGKNQNYKSNKKTQQNSAVYRYHHCVF